MSCHHTCSSSEVTHPNNGTSFSDADSRTQYLAVTSEQTQACETLAQLLVSITKTDAALVEVQYDDNSVSYLVAWGLVCRVRVNGAIIVQTLVINDVPAKRLVVRAQQ
jgi:hypothetical protein